MGVDEEVGGRRREGEKTDAVTVGKRSTETESKCERGDEKQKKEVESMSCFLGGRTAPCCRGFSV